MFNKALASILALFFMASLVLVSASVSADAKGHKANSSVTGDSFSLVVLNSTDGLAHWGGQVTFTVSTTATTEPHVSLKCSQNGVVVYSAQSGFYASYPWPWTQIMTLSSAAWSGGSADCAASLYYFSGTNTVTLGTLSFTAYP